LIGGHQRLTPRKKTLLFFKTWLFICCPLPNQLDLRLAFPYLHTLCNLTLFEHQDRNWARTFADAFRGIFLAFRSEKCFTVHFIATLLVIALSWWLEVTQTEALLLTFCVLGVLGLE